MEKKKNNEKHPFPMKKILDSIYNFYDCYGTVPIFY